MIKVTINKKELEIKENTLLKDLVSDFQKDYKNEIILAKVDGIYKELNDRVKKECDIEFFDLTDCGANKVYLNGLILLTVYAYKKIFGFKENIFSFWKSGSVG